MKNRVEIIPGTIYGVLKVLSEAEPDKNRVRRVNVLCQNCGKESEMYLRSLQNNIKSCKHCKTEVYRKYQDKDLIGKKFGRLTIVSTYVERVRGVNVRRAVCDCDCGKKNHVSNLGSIVYGSSRSCGCLRLENMKKATQKKKPEKRTGEQCESCRVYFTQPNGFRVICEDCRVFLHLKNPNDPKLKFKKPIYKERGT